MLKPGHYKYLNDLKILLVNIKFLGDLVVSTPAIRSLRKTYPYAEIVLIVRKGFEEVFDNNPYINRIILFDPDLKGNNSFSKILSGINFIRQLRKEKFDVVISLHPADRVALWSWFSGAKTRIAPSRQSLSFLINNKVNVDENSISYLEYYNKIVKTFNVNIDSNKTELFLSEEDISFAEEFLKEKNILSEKIFIGIHPSASEPTKIWKSENFITLINKLSVDEKLFMLIFEGPQDGNIITELKSKLTTNNSVFFIKQNLSKTFALIKFCKLFLTHDTGTRHIAVALDTPVLALLPDDNVNFWNFYDEGDNHHFILGKRNIPVNDLSAKPFLDGISVDDVHKMIGSILKLW